MKKVVFVDATDIEVAEKDVVAIVTVCGPEEAKLVVSVLQVGVGELLGVTKDSSVSIV